MLVIYLVCVCWIPDTTDKYFIKYLTIDKNYEIFDKIIITKMIVYIVIVVI